ncbi:MAG: hypothetical protein Q9218_002957 [Villophora microphyllina]
MSAPTNRLMLRQARVFGRRSGQRHASTTSQAADAASTTVSKSKEAASNMTSKASQGLSRVTSSGGTALSGATQRVSNVLGRIGGRTGRLISFVNESVIPPTTYYTRVGFEISKIVFKGQKMSPPSLAAFQSFSQPLVRAVRHPRSMFVQTTESSSATPGNILTRIRNMTPQELATAGVVAAEVLGFFTVGEMIGRFRVVGSTKLQKHGSSTGARIRRIPSAADSGHIGNHSNGEAEFDEVIITGGKRKRLPGERPLKSQVPQDVDLVYRSKNRPDSVQNQNGTERIKTNDSLLEKPTQVEGKPQVLNMDQCRTILKQNRLKATLLTPLKSHSSGEERRKRRHKRLSGRQEDDVRVEKTRVQLTPQPLQSFGELSTRYLMSKRLAINLKGQGYRSPTEVQLGALPILLGNDKDRGLQDHDNRGSDERHSSQTDLLTVAPTGSGKTLAFLVPLLHGLLQNRRHQKIEPVSNAEWESNQALILAPTHELVDQIVNEGKKLAHGTGIRVVRMRKGMSLDMSSEKDLQNGLPEGHADEEASKTFRVKAKILVGTPSLLLQATETGSDKASKPIAAARYLVLDEADVLLDALFRTQTLDVWNQCTNPNLQTSLWSATIGSSIEHLAQTFILDRRRKLGLTSRKPEHYIIRLVVGLKDSAVPNISHQLVYAATEQGKLMALRQLIHPTASTTARNTPSLQPPFLVFTQTIPRAIALHSELLYDIPPEAGGSSRIAVLHSGLSDTARSAIMAGFRKGEIWILITTDLLARGIDFRGVNGVVNYDIPNTSGVYVHRVGRTGRQGREGGVAVTLYTKEDIKYVKNVANVIAVSEKQRGSSHQQGLEEGGEGLQKWLLDALPDVSKKAKKELKRKGVEGRRPTAKGDEGAREARRMRISTKSGYERRLEQKKKDVFAGSSRRRPADNEGSDDHWEGIGD